jgi:hypothetical protein
VKALDSKEINGRRLRVRAAGDKEKKPGDAGYRGGSSGGGGSGGGGGGGESKNSSSSGDKASSSSSSNSRRTNRNREVRVSDVKGHLTYAFIGFLQREKDEVGVDEGKKDKMGKAIDILKEAFDIPEDDSLKVNVF